MTALDADWPPAGVRAVETTVVYPWTVTVETASGQRRTPYGGITDTEIASTAAVYIACRRHGPGATGTVHRALHHMWHPDYDYRALVCTATVDPTTGEVVFGDV